ncbi:VOC family protein [Loigolactobacillus rennini]|uniref:Glyoxalase bleomycin resistance protein dioxygenase n=1 Tax=Loigolactobacillus rennini DSM 20253 TaxID=1423796 RepID=A0A0R2CTR8_9LACO|nr:VOC family protein [Loigolactobacillus rennini]KRM94805.1 glyoxalase bleomycin resistance protein dioxygenase [Loigolactobacillus rennini DSM 20253]
MKISHVALYVNDLEQMRAFYETYFNAQVNQKYHNPQTGLITYFLTFADQTRLELMQRPDVMQHPHKLVQGYTHVAFSLGDSALVDQLTSKLAAADYKIANGPRTTGDGYYESVVLDPEGNQIELTI